MPGFKGIHPREVNLDNRRKITIVNILEKERKNVRHTGGKLHNRSLIGEGTFGKVYHGYHTILGWETAIKVLKISTKCEAQKRLDNFIREARVLAKVDDPRVVKIYDVFLSEEGPCIAMEFVRGENLHDYYQMFDRSYSEIAMLFGQAVQGLNTLHRCNIVHRD